MTTTVRECGELLRVIAGHDPLDSTSSAEPVDDYAADVGAGVRALRFGVVREAVEKLEGEVRENFEKALDVLRRGGAMVEEASVPTIGYAIAVYYIVANAEASANLSRFDGTRYGHRSATARTLRRVHSAGARRSQAAASRPRRSATNAARTVAYSDTTSPSGRAWKLAAAA